MARGRRKRFGYEHGRSGDNAFHKIRCKICGFQTVPDRNKHAPHFFCPYCLNALVKAKERPKKWLSGNDYIKMDKQLIWCHAVGGEEVPCDVYRSRQSIKGEFTTSGYTDACHYVVFVGEAPGAVYLEGRLATCWGRLKASD